MTTEQKKHGSNKRQLTAQIALRLSAEQKQEIETNSLKTGISAQEYMRRKIFGKPTLRAKNRVPVDRGLLLNALRELNMSGNNINQIARSLNRGHEAERYELHRMIATHKSILLQIAAAFGKEAKP